MSIKTMQRVWDNSEETASDLITLLALADHADDDGICWPGIDRVSKKNRLSPRQTKRVIKKLETDGEIYLSMQGGKGGGRGNTNLYFIIVGLSQEEISDTLQRRFEMSEREANAITSDLVERKGVTSVTQNSPKGDTHDTLEKVSPVSPKVKKGDTQGSKRVTSRVKKGDIAMSPESLEPSFKPSEDKNKDYLTNVAAIAQQEKPDLEPEPSPFDKHFGGARDEIVNIYNKTFKVVLERGKAEALIEWYQEKPDFDLERYTQSCKTVYLAGVKSGNILVIFDTYNAGGDYRQLFKKNPSPGGRQGQRQSESIEFQPAQAIPAPETETLTAEEQTWKDALARLQFSMPETVFNQWFTDTVALPRSNGVFHIGTHSEAGQQWLSNRLVGQIKRILSSLDGTINSVEIEVIPLPVCPGSKHLLMSE